jgi:hypothetical protein
VEERDDVAVSMAGSNPGLLSFAFHLGCSRALYEPELNLIEVFASVSLPHFLKMAPLKDCSRSLH